MAKAAHWSGLVPLLLASTLAPPVWCRPWPALPTTAVPSESFRLIHDTAKLLYCDVLCRATPAEGFCWERKNLPGAAPATGPAVG